MRVPILRTFRRAFGHVADRARASRRGALLWILVVAVEKQLPLIPVLEAYAEDAGKKWGSYALRIVAALRAGLSLPDALRNVPGAVPGPALLAAQVGAETGTLGPALRTAAESHSSRQDAVISLQGFMGYALAVLGIAAAIAGFNMLWIAPKLIHVYSDLQSELPLWTRTVLSVGDTLFGYFYLLLLFGMLAGGAYHIFYEANRADSDLVVWLRRWFPSRWFPDLERLLAVVVEAGRPIDSALSTFASYHPSESIRNVLQQVQREVNAGNPLWGSLAEKGILSRGDASVLAAAERVGNLPWALRAVADNTERRAAYRAQVVIEFLQPAVILFVGALVAAVVIAYFLPLLKLIGDLS